MSGTTYGSPFCCTGVNLTVPVIAAPLRRGLFLVPVERPIAGINGLADKRRGTAPSGCIGLLASNLVLALNETTSELARCHVSKCNVLLKLTE